MLPGAIPRTSFVKMWFTKASAPGPSMKISPMWETSNMPTLFLTARCSWVMDEYWMGIMKPAKGLIFACSCMWQGYRQVSLSSSDIKCFYYVVQ